MSFDKLTLKELVRVADEDFALELTPEEQKSKKLVQAAFVEAGWKFEDYLLANPQEREKYEPEPTEAVEVQPLPSNTVEDGVVVRPASPQPSTDPWLIRMTRENPLYEVGKYRFTKTHPYALVAPEDAEKVLSVDGFRQAYPTEVDEFYG